MAFLSRRILLAQQEHWCDRCLQYIEPGDFYERLVQTHNRRLITFRYHVFPLCEFPPDPPDEREKDLTLVEAA